jgi:hypothetical protein
LPVLEVVFTDALINFFNTDFLKVRPEVKRFINYVFGTVVIVILKKLD